jgi:hypothetical protein
MSEPETCFLCQDPRPETWPDDPKTSIPLCQRHWNRWIVRFLGADDVPCAAHLMESAR